MHVQYVLRRRSFPLSLRLVDRCRVLTAKRDAERKEESSDEDAEVRRNIHVFC